MDSVSVRKITTAISAAALITVAGLLVIPVVDSFGGITVEDTTSLNISYDGSGIIVGGSLTVRSNLNSNVSDFCLNLYAFDPSNGAKTLLCSVDDLNLPAGKTVTVPVSGEVSFWKLFNIINSNLGSDQSKLCFKAIASFSYLFGLVHADADVDFSYRLSEPGKTISYTFEPATDHDMVLKVENLAEYLMPEVLNMTFAKGTDTMTMDLGQDNEGRLVLELHTSGVLDSVLSDMCAGGYTATVNEGSWDGSTDDLLTLFHYLREIQ